jgi:hypothetical protein
MAWSVVLGMAGVIGLYHLIAHILQKPLIGVSNILNGIGRRMFRRLLRGAELTDRFNVDEEVEFKGGRMNRMRHDEVAPPGKLL